MTGYLSVGNSAKALKDQTHWNYCVSFPPACTTPTLRTVNYSLTSSKLTGYASNPLTSKAEGIICLLRLAACNSDILLKTYNLLSRMSYREIRTKVNYKTTETQLIVFLKANSKHFSHLAKIQYLSFSILSIFR